MTIKTDFTINQQEAENLGSIEYINGILAGLHYFTKQAGLFFKDINQKDECMIGEKKVKIYTRDAFADEDMLIYDSYYEKHPEIDIYILCKIKGGKYSYIGFIERNIVDLTRVVQMIGEDSTKASASIRRIFAEQYKNLSEIIAIEEKEIKETKIIEPQKYVPLHMHSEFSVGDAYGKINYITDKLKEKGFKGAALTDHGTLAGVWEFQKACLAKDLKPIIGIEIYTKTDYTENERCHTIVLVKNETGWNNLLKLHSTAARENFYHKPIIMFDDLMSNSEGLIVTSGCISSPIPKLISKKKFIEADILISRLKDRLGDDFYIELQAHTFGDNQEVMQKLHRIAIEKNIKCIFTTDSHYPDKQDKKYHEAVKAIDRKTNYGEAGYGDDCFYLMQNDDVSERVKSKASWMLPYIDDFLVNTNEIFDKCNFKITPQDSDDTLPKIEFEDMSRKEKLKQLCYEGLEKYTKYKITDETIKQRLDLEIDRILNKGYENYFLIVYDLVKWTKEQGIMVGPGRGSVGASLAAFALNITECDPIEHELLFDRFLSEIRRDMPDIDMDFQDDRRDEVFEYLKYKYGENNCAKVVTYSRFHPKGILRDIGRIFNLPSNEISKICSMVIERCISEDSEILISDGNRIKVKDLYKHYRIKDKETGKIKGKTGISYNFAKKKFKRHKIKDVVFAGEKQMFEIETVTGKKIEASEDHKFLTKTGWKRLKELKEDEEIMVFSEGVDYVKCKICNEILREVNTDHLIKHNTTKAEYFHKFSTKDVCETLSKEKGWQLGKKYVGRKLFGDENPMRDKTNRRKWYKRINDKDRRKKHSDWMKKNNPMFDKTVASKVMRSFSGIYKNGSKPQKKLYRLIKENYEGEVKFEHYVKTERSFRFLDIALLSERIDFEYDGSFWHETRKNKRDDKRRVEELKDIGWRVISIKEKDLTEDRIKSILKRLRCLKK